MSDGHTIIMGCRAVDRGCRAVCRPSSPGGSPLARGLGFAREPSADRCHDFFARVRAAAVADVRRARSEK